MNQKIESPLIGGGVRNIHHKPNIQFQCMSLELPYELAINLELYELNCLIVKTTGSNAMEIFFHGQNS